MKILDETQMFVTFALAIKQASVSGILENGNRGKHPPPNKHSAEIIAEVRRHIGSFAAYRSHYTR
jgi:hypothetical protein